MEYSIYGINAVNLLVDCFPQNIIKTFILKDASNKRLLHIKDKLNQLNVAYSEKTKHEIDKLSKSQKNQGILVFIKPLQFKTFNEFKHDIKNVPEDNLILVLDSIEDPRNLGACLRTANAAGVSAVSINKHGSASINEHVFKTSVGAIFNLKIYFVTNLSQSINLLKKNGFWIIGLDTNSSHSIYDLSFSERTAIVMGSESRGMKRLTNDSCDIVAKIPMKSNIDSLNVSVATGIALFEINRRHLQ